MNGHAIKAKEYQKGVGSTRSIADVQTSKLGGDSYAKMVCHLNVMRTRYDVGMSGCCYASAFGFFYFLFITHWEETNINTICYQTYSRRTETWTHVCGLVGP